MRFPKSLRKPVAASLALAMLTVPLSGCSRTVTTGGLSGKGVLGDLAVGGLYGGAMGGFFGGRKMSLPEGAYVLDRSRVSVERLMVEEAFCRSVRQYLTARLATERVARLEKGTFSKSEAVQLIRKAADEWKCLDEMLKRTQRMAKRLESREQKTQTPQKSRKSRVSWTLDRGFFSRAYAAGFMGAEEGSAEWAQKVQAAYDSFPSGQKIAGLTKALGAANPREAHDKLTQAGKILDKEGKWDVAKETAKGLGKGTAVVVGIAVVAAAPVGVAAAATALGTGVMSGSAVGTAVGVGTFAIGMTAVVSGTVAAGMHLGEDISGKKMEGEAAKARDTVDNIALYSGAANIVMSGGTSIYNAVKNATPDATKAQMAKEALKGYLGYSGPEIAYNAYGTYDAGKGLAEKGMGVVAQPTEDGKTALVPVEIPKDEPPPEVKPIEQLKDEELSVAAANYEADGMPEEKTERVKQLETMQQQPDKDDWIHWNANGITKAENDRIMREEPNDVRDHVAQRLEDYKNSDEYKEELEKREEAERDAKEASEEDRKKASEEGGKDSGEVSDDADFGHKKVIGATGTAEEDQPYYNIIIEKGKEKKIPYTIHWVHHFKVVGINKGYGFEIHDEPVVTAAGYGATSKAKPATFQVVSYDSGTGVGKVKVKNKTFPFAFSGKPGSMTLTIEGFKYAEPKK